MTQRKLFINTIGCQMNANDSEMIVRILAPMGYTSTTRLQEADLVIVNTCAIRAKAEQKAFSFLGRLAKLKRQNPGLVVGVAGCVAQQEGDRILSRMPMVDLVFGTHAIERLPGLIDQVMARRQPIVDVAFADAISELTGGSPSRKGGGVTRFVTVMQGCDNFCAYCVVPNTRGREMSRPPDRVIEEIRGLVESGVREVTLLGQNVNSYGQKEGLCGFPELLAGIDAIEGLRRVRFTTSHPKDLSEDLIRSFSNLETLCPHIHLPVQSGSDGVLKRMNRRYDRRTYLKRIEALRGECPGIAVTSDFIVGFPGETPSDFKASLDLIREVEFDGLFAFMYSDRPGAPASRFNEKVAEPEKKDRLQELLAVQEAITMKKHRALVGPTQRILVDGRSDGAPPVWRRSSEAVFQWNGRTGTNRIVNVDHMEKGPFRDAICPGRLVDVTIERALSHSLVGVPVDVEPFQNAAIGGICHVA
jgi:tRNA-2-methylthio-N6-dimethylallyladenosine synthase